MFRNLQEEITSSMDAMDLTETEPEAVGSTQLGLPSIRTQVWAVRTLIYAWALDLESNDWAWLKH